MLESLTIDINAPYPKYYEAYIHELDKYMISVYFYKNNEIFEVDVSENGSYNVEYNVTLNNNIIVTGAVARDIPGHNGVAIKLADLNINTSGILKIEFIIETREVPTPATVISPVSPLVINVKPSIIDEATVTPESEGTIAELLRLYPDLVAILADPTDYIPNGSITSAMIGDGEIRQADLHDSSVTGAKINNGAATNDKLADDAVTTSKILDGSVTLPKIDSSAYESTPTSGSSKLITSGAVYNALGGKLSFGGGTFSTTVTKTALDMASLTNDTLYKYRLAADFLYSGSPAMNAYVIQPDAQTRIFITFDEGLYKEEFGTSSWYACEPCVPHSIEDRLSALEAANTILENAINGVT